MILVLNTKAIGATITHEMVTGYQPGDPYIALPGYCGTPGDVTGSVHYYDNLVIIVSWGFVNCSITGGVLRFTNANQARATRAVSGF